MTHVYLPMIMFQVRRFLSLFHGRDGLFDRVDADVGVEEACGRHALLNAVTDQGEVVFPETVKVKEAGRAGGQVGPSMRPTTGGRRS